MKTEWGRNEEGARNPGIKMAERGGFEPPVEFDPYDGLANRSFRPLRHLSAYVQIVLILYSPFVQKSRPVSKKKPKMPPAR